MTTTDQPRRPGLLEPAILRPRRPRVLLKATIIAAVLTVGFPVGASIFGEENATLMQQLIQLIQIHQELQLLSDAAERSADIAHDGYDLYQKARAGVDDLKRYTTDKFLADVKEDVYNQYPGFEILFEGANSHQVRQWKDSRASSPFTAYQMISAVFGDLTDPLLKEKAKSGTIETDRAYIWRYEAAGALALSNQAEDWTKGSDKDARELYRLAADADAEQSQHLSARALALIAVQNSHVIRLLSRDVRLQGVRGAMEWAQRVNTLQKTREMQREIGDSFLDAVKPPAMLKFQSLP